jgi:MoxR-like ATPase
MRVKIVDEYNRIPTRTQSALLTLMADGYAEILDHVFEAPDSAWFLTANDDAGGGTYQVIEALRDRIDIVVRALPFNSRFLPTLLARIEEDITPQELVPRQITFTEEEIDRMRKEILAITIPAPVLRRLEFFSSHFEFCEQGGVQVEYKTKDTVKLAGIDFGQLSAEDTGRDLVKDLGSQTRNGLSVRMLLTSLTFVKALAFFRGARTVSLDDVRQILPFVLHDKLAQNPDSPFFDQTGHSVYRIDEISWIRKLFDLSCAEYDRLDLDRNDPVGELQAEFHRGLEGLSESEARARLVKIERLLKEWSRGRKLYGHVFDDVLALKYLHQRYTNYLRWLKWEA